MKSQLIGKDPHAKNGRRQKKKRAAEDEMVREHHHEFEQALGDSEGKWNLESCSPQCHKTRLKKPSMHHSLFNLFPMDGYFGSILFVSVFIFYCYITNYHKFSNLNNTHLLPHSFCGSHRLSESSAQHPTRLKSKCWPRLRYDFM